MEKEVEKAKQYSARLLALRPRSEHELRVRLQKRGLGKNVIDECLDSLKRVGLVDDAEFATAWVESRMRLRPMGRAGLRRELRAKGVAEDVARAAIESLVTEEAELEAARALAQRSLGARPTRGSIRRAQQALMRRGFDPAVVWQVLEHTAACETE